jgi:hypothetical protein
VSYTSFIITFSKKHEAGGFQENQKVCKELQKREAYTKKGA